MALMPELVHATDMDFALNRSRHHVIADTGRAVSFEVWKGQPGRPVYVTFNGLLFKQSYWDPFLAQLNMRGAGVVRIAFSADPESLLFPSRADAKAFSLDGLNQEISAVLDQLALSRVTLLPLSYGAIATHFAAQHPERVERLVLLAPMIQPMDNYDSQGAATRAYLENVRVVYGEAVYDYQWTLLMEPTARRLATQRIQAMNGYVPDTLSLSTVVGGAIEKIKATRHFDLRTYAPLRLPRVDMILSEGEQDGIFQDQVDFWTKLNPSSKGNFVLMRQTQHALIADAPIGAAMAINALELLDGSPQRPFMKFEITKDGTVISQAPRR
jgi:pimeloyl-ACP methyl ester carboxylesterase